MEVLSTKSLVKLKKACKENPWLIEKSLKELINEFELNLISEPSYGSFKLNSLKISSDSEQSNKYELENCITIFESLKSLSPSQATDERLWATLCFGTYSEYTKSRWPIKTNRDEFEQNNKDLAFYRAENEETEKNHPEKKTIVEEIKSLKKKIKPPINHVKTHWFAKSNRERYRDNSVARLWWMAHLAQKANKTEYKSVLRIILFNSDYRANLLERTTTASSAKLLACVTEISYEAFKNNKKYERSKFRNFMKTVDLVGKRTSLPSLSPDKLKEILTPLYDDAYK